MYGTFVVTRRTLRRDREGSDVFSDYAAERLRGHHNERVGASYGNVWRR